jgi:hypothetical protein
MATGTNAPATRHASAALTTPGPDSHARRSKSGTLRKARAREPQPFQNLPFDIGVSMQTHAAQCKSFALSSSRQAGRRETRSFGVKHHDRAEAFALARAITQQHERHARRQIA